MLAPLLLLAMLAPSPASGTGSQAPALASAFILRCDMGAPTADATGGVRTFRLAPSVFQEWRADRHEFGPNLCGSFRCRADKARLEGVIESRTLILTITMDRSARSATWKTRGASGLSRTQGACTVTAEKQPAAGALKGSAG